jgi:uncharacterized membrane protein YebE (DUF533 family)
VKLGGKKENSSSTNTTANIKQQGGKSQSTISPAISVGPSSTMKANTSAAPSSTPAATTAPTSAVSSKSNKDKEKEKEASMVSHKVAIRKLPATREYTRKDFELNLLHAMLLIAKKIKLIDESETIDKYVTVDTTVEESPTPSEQQIQQPYDGPLSNFYQVDHFIEGKISRKRGPIYGAGYINIQHDELYQSFLSQCPGTIPFTPGKHNSSS